MILVRPAGFGAFAEFTTVQPSEGWEYQVSFTGPVLKEAEVVIVASSDPFHVPLSPSPIPGLPVSTVLAVLQGLESAIGEGAAVVGSGTLDTPSTITAFFKRADGSVTSKTALVHLSVLK
jgi:hypothetical protein